MDIDFTPTLDDADLSPDEALSSLQDALKLDMDVNTYIADKDDYKPLVELVDQPKGPVMVTDSVAKNITNRATASIIKQDNEAEKLSYLEKHSKNFTETIRGGGVNRQANHAAWEVMKRNMFGAATDEQDMEMMRLNAEATEMQQKRSELGLGFFESLPAEVSNVGVDYARGIIDEGVTGWGILIPAVTTIAGAVAGSPSGPGGILGGAYAGYKAGKAPFILTSSSVDSFVQSSGDAYRELSFATDEKTGEPINLSEAEKRAYSLGLATVITSIETGAELVLIGGSRAAGGIIDAKTIIKWARKNPTMEKAIKMLGESSISKRFLGAAGVEGVTEAVQEIAQIATLETAKYDFTTSEGISDYIDQIVNWENTKQVTKSGIIGAAAGMKFTAIDLTASKVLPRNVEPLSVVDQAKIAFNSVESGTSLVDSIDTKMRVSELVGANAPDSVRVKGVEAVALTNAIITQAEYNKTSNFAEMTPEESSKITRDSMAANGFTEAWVPRDKFNMFFDTDEKVAQFESIVGSEVIDGDAPLKITPEQAVRIEQQFPGFTKDNVMPSPEGMTTAAFQQIVEYRRDQARQILNKEKAAQDTLTKVIGPEPTTDVIVDELSGGRDLTAEEITNLRARGDLDVSDVNRKKEYSESELSDIVVTKETADALISEIDSRLEAEIEPLKADNTDKQKAAREANLVRQIKLKRLKEKVQSVYDGLATYDDGRLRDADVSSESDYYNQNIIPDNVTDVLGDKLTHDTIMAVKEARQEVIEAIDNASDLEQSQMVDLVQAMDLEVQMETLEATIDADPEITMVDNFMNGKGDLILTPEMKAGIVKGKPPVQINYDSLTDAQKSKYGDDVVLKRRKAIVKKKGVSLEEAARIYGTTPDALLNTLATVPNKTQALKNAVENYKAISGPFVSNSVDRNEAVISRAYAKKAKAYGDIVAKFKDQNWSTFKGLLKKIAFNRRSPEAIRTEARQVIGNTKVGDLNVNQWVKGEQRASKRAFDDTAAGRIEKAMHALESAILNSELALATRVANTKIARANHKLAKLTSTKNLKAIKQAGGDVEAYVNNLLNVFDFDSSAKVLADEKSRRRYVEKMIEQGNGDMTLPEAFWVTEGKVDPKSLTVNEYLFLVERLSQASAAAKLKNGLTTKFKGIYGANSQAILSDVIGAHLKKHNDHDIDRASSDHGEKSAKEKAASKFRKGLSFIQNIQAYATLMDMGDRNGLMSKLILDPLKGVGVYASKKVGEKYAVHMNEVLRGGYISAMKKNGLTKKKLHEYMNTQVKHEVLNTPGIKIRSLTKMDVFQMAHHIGNIDNMSALTNFGLTETQIMTLVEDTLSQSDLDVIQEGIWDNNERNSKSELARVYREVEGRDLEWTEAQGFTMFGKDYAGGHMRLTYTYDSTFDAALHNQVNMENPKYAGTILGLDGIVKNPHAKERRGSNALVNLNPMAPMMAFNDVAYDIAMKEPVKFVSELLLNKDNAENIQAIVGREGYDTLKGLVASTTRSNQSHQMQNFADGTRVIQKASASIASAYAVSFLYGSVKTMMIQFKSMINAGRSMGVFSGTKYISKALVDQAKDMASKNWSEKLDFAIENDPSLKSYTKDIDVSSVLTYDDAVPNRKLHDSDLWYYSSELANNGVKAWFKYALGGIDIAQKTLVFHAAFNQYMDGNAPKQNTEAFMKLTNEQKINEAIAYATKINSGSLTSGTGIDTAPIQKMPNVSIFAKFWNDRRNELNNNLNDMREVRWNAEKSMKALRKGDYEEAASYMMDSGTVAIRAAALAYAGISLQKAIAKQMFPDMGDDDDGDDEESTFMKTVYGVAGITDEMFLGNIPFLDGISYYVQGKLDRPRANISPGTLIGTFTKDVGDVVISGVKTLQDIVEGATLAEAYENLKPQEKTAFFRAVNVTMKTLPVHAVRDFVRVSEAPEEYVIPIGYRQVVEMVNSFTDFIDDWTNKKDIDPVSDLPSMPLIEPDVSKPLDDAPDALVPQEYKDEVNVLSDPQKAARAVANMVNEPRDDISDAEYNVIKMLESGGRAIPVSTDPKTGKPYSSAFGYYQFLSGTWSDIMRQAPHLGLSEEGRTDPDMVEQEIAMRWFTKNNIKYMNQHGVQPNIYNAYGAHHFGAKGWTEVIKKLQRNPFTPVTSVFSDRVRMANPWISKSKNLADAIARFRNRINEKMTDEMGLDELILVAVD